MEKNNEVKVNNGFYVAVSVLCFVFASLLCVVELAGIILLAEGSIFSELITELVNQGYVEESAIQAVEALQSLAIVYMCVFVGAIVVMFIEGAYFKKYSRLTNAEAEQYFGRCLGWVITSYFFGGLIVGGLATAGLCVVQNRQRKELETTSTWTTSTGTTVDVNTNFAEKVKEDKFSSENLEKMKMRLQKLKDLKESGAISEEEYNSLRSKVMGEKKEEQPNAVVDDNPNELNSVKLDKISQRLAKIKKLKEDGALTEEEYNKLRDKILTDEA